MVEKKVILIIGGSSFVANSFIRYHKGNYSIQTVSRTKTEYHNEVIITDFGDIPNDLFEKADIVINCAAVVHQQKSTPTETYHQINYELALSLGRKAKASGVKFFVQLSSISVYGGYSFIDESTIEKPSNDYGKSKLLADKHLLKLASNNFVIIIMRAPMVYGGIGAKGNMIRLVHLVNKGFPLPFKNALNKRTFIHIRNLIGYIEAAILNKQTNIYLVGDSKSTSTKDLVELIANKLNTKLKLITFPNWIVSLLIKIKPNIFEKLYGTLIVDTKFSSKTLNYYPNYSIEDGIEEMINNLKTN